jgi:anti-sigma factor RsiW
MPHVDDGTLHAYLDGQLAPVERAQVEGHLASCPACRARLDEERALIERADALLALATPPERAVPPFHELRHPRPAWRFRLPAVWAATVFLALGLGWYLGGARGNRALETDVVRATRADSGATNTLALRQPEPVRKELQRRVVTPPTTLTRERADERAADRAAASSVAQPSAGAPVASVPSASLQVPPPVERAEPQADLKPTQARPTPNAATRLDAVVVSGRAAQPALAREELAVPTTSWSIIPRDAARPTLGVDPVTIPGLPVRDVRRSPLDDGVILVEQGVDSTTLVQLFQWRADQAQERVRRGSRVADALAPTAKAQGVERLARFVGRLRVEIAGPLPTDSLSKLLELVK